MRFWMKANKLAIAVLALVVMMTGARVAAAQDPKAQAKALFASGEAKFKAGEFRAAIADFEAADRLVPSPILSYNIGLCHEKLGEDELAVARFKDYLARRPDAQNRASVEERIAAAEQRIAARKAPPPAVEGPKPPPPAVEGPKPPPPQPEGPALPPAGPAAPAGAGGGGDPALMKRIPSRGGGAAPAAPGASNPDETMVGQLGGGGQAEAAPGSAPGSAPAQPLLPTRDQPKKKAKPLYKEWWFWAVVGVSALILIDMANDDSPSSAAQPGAVLFTF